MRRTNASDIESQTVSSAPVAQGFPVMETAPTVAQPPPRPSIYIIETYPQQLPPPSPIGRPDPRPGMVICAIIGLSFSWIPIIGCFTLVFNLDAPKGSLRQMLASSACCISTLIFVFTMLFWPFWVYY